MTLSWRRSLAAQFIALMLAALVLSQALTFLISLDEYTRKFDTTVKGNFISRVASVTRLMDSLPPEMREQALRASEGSYLRYWLTDREPLDANAWRLEARRRLARPLNSAVDPSGTIGWAGAQQPRLPDAAEILRLNGNDPWVDPTPFLSMVPDHAVKALRFAGNRGFGFRSQLGDGTWLNAAFYQHDKQAWWASDSLMSLALTALVLALIGGFIARWIARPLRDLATAAEAFGRGENLPPLPEAGPEEVARTARSFNTMQRRLHRFVEDRTKMLAAIGHDLRTPLTSLKLRTEFVNNEDVQRRMLSTIGEIEAMTEAAIAFAQGQATNEETRPIELEALVGSICDDLADLGHPATFVEGAKITYRCRPAGLRRAVRNLIENAVRYGGEAKVHIRQTAWSVDIVVEDSGPGIPEEMREKVFAPFFRLETSRSRETGGIGLGLSIARAVARQHGGDISFCDGGSGMQTVMSLPRDGVAFARAESVHTGVGWKAPASVRVASTRSRTT